MFFCLFLRIKNYFPKKKSSRNLSKFSLSPNEAPTSTQSSIESLNTKPRPHKFDGTSMPCRTWTEICFFNDKNGYQSLQICFILRYKPGVSNTRPASRMWPTWCVCAARVIIKSPQIIVKISVFCAIKALFTIFCGPRRHILFVCSPRAPFLPKCGPRIDLSLRPLL